MDRTAGQRLGELHRDRGVLLAATGRRERMDRAALRMLDALVMSTDGSATSDVIPDDLAGAWGDGGKWVGAMVRTLAQDGLMHRLGYVASCRPSRHGCPVGVWAVADRYAVDRRRELRALLAAMDAAKNDAGESVTADSPAVDWTANPTQNGESSDGPTD